MSDDHIKSALVETVKQFAEVKAQEDALERQKMELQHRGFKLLLKIHGLADLCDDLPANSRVGQLVRRIERDGMTNAVRNILMGTGEWLSPAQIRDYLIRFRIDFGRYKNPAGTIHTILGRLVESGQVEPGTDPKTSKPVFRWKQPTFVEFNEVVTSESVAEVMITPRRKKKAVGKAKNQRLLTPPVIDAEVVKKKE